MKALTSKGKRLLYRGLLLACLFSVLPGCKKGEADKIKEELKVERKKREEISEKYKEALQSLAEERKRAENLERIVLELGEKLEKQGKVLPKEASEIRTKKREKEEAKEREEAQEKTREKLLELGNQFYSKGNYPAAKEVYSSALELGVRDPLVYMRLGKCCIEANENDKAIPFLEEAVTQLEEKGDKEQLCPLYNNLGWLYIEKKKFKEAEKTYLKAIKLNPDYANAYYNLGLLYDLHLKDELGAIECFEKYIELKGERAAYVQKRLAEIKQR